MIEDAVKRIDDAYTLRKLEEMISINSVVRSEGELAEYIKAELDALGLKAETHMVEPGRPNVYARLRGDKPGKRINYNGHLDTVPVVEGWETDPFTPTRRGDHLIGLGSCDMKAGFASILTMVKAIQDSGHRLRGELSVGAVIDEEAYGEGAKAMLKTDFGKVDAIVLAEPYPCDESKPMPLGITGKILYDVTVRGKAAHGFRPQHGVNAVEDAAKIVANLDKLSFLDHPDFHVGNYCTLKFEGGYQIYSVVVPASARFEVNRLLVPGETAATAIADMERLVKTLNLKSTVEVKTKPPQYEAYVMSKDDPLIKAFDPVYRNVMGKAPVYQYAYGITDANTYAGVGKIPCLHLGPARGFSDPKKGGGTHEKNEYVDVTWLPKVSRMYVKVADAFLNK
ncbi:MAG: M20/M25/M40 family metallo-hydrolase [Candidatus Bathyarchaeota archaeon]|nr:M20/M25/M40 family metallo-hydrolase [Candidatus Bathyarchaeota archaeon]